MATKAIQFKIPQQPSTPAPFRLTAINGGINISDEQSQIRDNQSPYMLNVNCDDRGAIQKRPGYGKLYTTSLGAGAINGYFDYRKLDGTVVTLLAHSTKLYTQSGTNQPVEIMSGLANAKAAFFVFNDVCYMVNGTDFVQYDGTTASRVVGYVPTITLSMLPDGSAAAENEQLNILSNSWKDSFNANGTATVYTLSYSGLSVTTVKAWISGVEKTEGTDFTVDRTTGKVTFSSPPAAGVDNVVIQAEKANLNDSTQITKCKYAVIFGGSNDTRILFTGNPDATSTVFWSGLVDPTYWPIDCFAYIGSDADFNTGFAVQYDQLVLFKEHSIYRIEYVGGTNIFASYPLNSVIGCDMPYSIQLINNTVVFANTHEGVHILARTDVRTEKNVMPLSTNINGTPFRPGLLDEAKADLLAATSTDYDGKYWLCVGSKVWLWDYQLSPYVGRDDILSWFYYTNIPAKYWLIRDGELYFGERENGLIQKFKANDVTPGKWSDNGVEINAVWRSKLMYYDLPEWLKTIKELHLRTREVSNTIITVKYYVDSGEDITPIELISSSFSWSAFSWSTFSWSIHKFPPVFKLRPKLKKTVYFQFEVSNNNLNQNLTFMDLVIRYVPTKVVK